MDVGDLIRLAAVMTGQIEAGENLAPEAARYAWDKLEDLLDLLKTNRLAFFRRQRVGPFAVTSGMGDITATSPILIGSGATWNTPRPVWIDKAGVIYTSGSIPYPELKVHVFTVKEWSEICVKGITSTLSRALIYDQNYTSSGYGHIYLYPVPSASFQVVLYVPVAVDEFAVDANGNPDFTTTIALPPGYRPMLISNLAKILCIGVRAIDADLRDEATRTLESVMMSNVVQTMDALGCDEATINPGASPSQAWNWITGNIN